MVSLANPHNSAAAATERAAAASSLTLASACEAPSAASSSVVFGAPPLPAVNLAAKPGAVLASPNDGVRSATPAIGNGDESRDEARATHSANSPRLLDSVGQLTVQHRDSPVMDVKHVGAQPGPIPRAEHPKRMLSVNSQLAVQPDPKHAAAERDETSNDAKV